MSLLRQGGEWIHIMLVQADGSVERSDEKGKIVNYLRIEGTSDRAAWQNTYAFYAVGVTINARLGFPEPGLAARLWPLCRRMRIQSTDGNCMADDALQRLALYAHDRLAVLDLEFVPPAWFTLSRGCNLTLTDVDTSFHIVSSFGAPKLSLVRCRVETVKIPADDTPDFLYVHSCDQLVDLETVAKGVAITDCSAVQRAVLHHPEAVTVWFCACLTQLEIVGGMRSSGSVSITLGHPLERFDPGDLPLDFLDLRPGTTPIPLHVQLTEGALRHEVCGLSLARCHYKEATARHVPGHFVYARRQDMLRCLRNLLVMIAAGKRRRAPRLPRELWAMIRDEYFMPDDFF